MKIKYKVLILVPSLSSELIGGIKNYYQLFKKYFKSDKIDIDFFYIGKRKNYVGIFENIFVRSFQTIKDVFNFMRIVPKYDLIHFNTSMNIKCVLRDGLYHFISKRIFRKKTFVFFRGWLNNFVDKIKINFSWLFKYFLNFDKCSVQSSSFKKNLIDFGYNKNKIILETTAYEDFETKKKEFSGKKILFLSRFDKGKGCIEAIKTIELLSKKYQGVVLYMAGEGIEKKNLEKYVRNHCLEKNVKFLGYVKGENKMKILNETNILILPSYSEGLPNSILEAMGAGLAIITRPVGGIPEIFKEGKNGFLVKSLNPMDFANAIEKLIKDNKLLKQISDYNIKYAKENFEIRKVVKRIEKIYLGVLND